MMYFTTITTIITVIISSQWEVKGQSPPIMESTERKNIWIGPPLPHSSDLFIFMCFNVLGVLRVALSSSIFTFNVCQHEKAQQCKQRNTNARCVLNCVDWANQLQFRLFHFHHSLSPKTLFGASRTPLNLLSPSPLVHDEGLLQIFRNSETTV